MIIQTTSILHVSISLKPRTDQFNLIARHATSCYEKCPFSIPANNNQANNDNKINILPGVGRKKRDGNEGPNDEESCQILPPKTKALIGALTSWNIIMKHDGLSNLNSHIVHCPGSVEELIVNNSLQLIR